MGSALESCGASRKAANSEAKRQIAQPAVTPDRPESGLPVNFILCVKN